MIFRDQEFPDQEQMLRVAMEALQAKILTALPCFVLDWDADANTVTLQPAIKGQRLKTDNSLENYDPAPLLDCPVIWPQGGGFVLTFPLQQGDEVMALVSQRNPDGWVTSGGGSDGITPQVAPQFRMHSWSDAFCLAGVRSTPRKIADISQTSTQLRSNDGNTFVEVDSANNVNLEAAAKVTTHSQGDTTVNSGGKVTVTAATSIELNATTIKLTATSLIELIAPQIKEHS